MSKAYKNTTERMILAVTLFLTLLPITYVFYTEIRDYSPLAGIGFIFYLTIGVFTKYTVLALMLYKYSFRIKSDVRKKNIHKFWSLAGIYISIEFAFIASYIFLDLYSALQGILSLYAVYALSSIIYAIFYLQNKSPQKLLK